MILINAVRRAGRRIAAITAILVLASCRSDLNDLIGPEPTASIGAIAVAVDSLPQGVSASIVVTGADGFHQELSGAGMLSSLPPGTYTIVASGITIGSQHFTPVPATQTITIGNSTTALPVEITYVEDAPTVGSLTVSVGGLPAGAAPALTLGGPNAFSQQLGAAGSIGNLAPGSYTLAAADVVSGGITYQAQPASQTFTVTAGNDAAASVAYAAVAAPVDPSPTSSLSLTVAGLPGVSGDVQIAGPAGFTQAFGNSGTVAGLAPGSYTITAHDLTITGTTYTAQPASQNVTLNGGATTSATVTYTPQPVLPPAVGTLALVVSGLPNGASGAVTVSGPAGFTHGYSASTAISGLAPGSYTVTAAPVTAGGFAFAPTASSQVVTVVSGNASAVEVQYASADGDLTVTIGGLSSGSAASVTVTGPNGYSQLLTATQTLTALGPGNYTIAAATVWSGGYGYSASSPTQVEAVAAGSSVNATVTYAASTANLNLSVTGLPAGTGAITIAGPGGFSQTSNGSHLLTGLAPGAYTLSAASATVSGAGYTPSPWNQSITLTAGSTTPATVAYSFFLPAPPSTGSIAVTVAGLPGGTSGDVTVSGPGLYSHHLTGSETLSGLSAGAYSVVSAAVSSGGVTYNPSTATQSATVAGGSTTTVTVTYTAAAPVTGSLAVTVAGLPSGASGSVTVTGPGGYSQALTASQTLTGLAAGTYTIAAGALWASGFTWSPAVLSQTKVVTTGATAAATVTYSAVSATVSVTISGLPSGTGGSVMLSGPGGFSQAMTATQSLSGLPSGSFSVVAANVTSGSTTYAPTPATQSLTVAQGTVGNATVAYSVQAPPPPTTGLLNVTVSGLPAGTSGSVIVTGPNAFSQTVTASQLLTSLAPGSYTITAANVTSGSTTYTATPVSQTKSVTAGATTAASVAYAAVVPTTGALAVTVAGLPGGVSGNVTVTGPGSFTQTLTATQTLNGLATGSYTVAAATVTGGATTYVPTVASQSATVTAGGTAAVTVTYAAVAPLTGALTVTSTGLPTGVNASITVTGPNSYSHAVTATTTLSGLTVGTYNIAAASVTSGSTTYSASVSSASVSVTAGGTATTTVTYTAVPPATGALTVTATGLPGGVSANITVTGPNSYSQAVTATATLNGLTVGAYTISAGSVTSGGTTYTASVSSPSVSVTSGGTATTTVTYSAPSGLPALTPGFHARSFTINDPTNGNKATTFNYQLYIPQGYSPTGTPWPVILSNHGSGERGNNNTSQLGVGLGAHIAAVGERAIIVFPQEPVTSGGSQAVIQLLYLVEKGSLDEALTVVNADLKRIYLTGNSAGAIRGWKQVYEQPTRFAAFFPTSGEVLGKEITGNDASTNAQGQAAVVAKLGNAFPIHIYHGAADGTVDVNEDRTLAAAFTAAGATAPTFLYTEYPGLGHGPTWDTAFEDQALWTWLFAQHR